jgi:hypothetical protein
LAFTTEEVVMLTFRIYQHPTHGYQAVKLGFGWPALLFGWMWMFSKRMWELGLVWLGAQLGLFLVEAVTSQANQADLQGLMYLLVFAGRIGLAVAAGLKGNEWRVQSLERHGYVLRETVQAGTPDAALAQFAAPSRQATGTMPSASQAVA